MASLPKTSTRLLQALTRPTVRLFPQAGRRQFPHWMSLVTRTSCLGQSCTLMVVRPEHSFNHQRKSKDRVLKNMYPSQRTCCNPSAGMLHLPGTGLRHHPLQPMEPLKGRQLREETLREETLPVQDPDQEQGFGQHEPIWPPMSEWTTLKGATRKEHQQMTIPRPPLLRHPSS